jgi:hypothetical protein
MFVGTMLIVMFADVFVQHTIGYIVVAVLILSYGFVVQRFAVGQPEPNRFLPFEPLGIQREAPLCNPRMN